MKGIIRANDKLINLFQVFKRAKASGMPLDTVDSCSLLMRLDMEGRFCFLAVFKQKGQDGPGSLTWFFEIALANFFFFVAFREELTRISVCLYSARSLHSLIPWLFTDQNFKNNSEKGHSRNISMRLFQNLTNSFREDFLWFYLCSYSQVAPFTRALFMDRSKFHLHFWERSL